ncbi:flagellar protein [Thraustotheca clavata]|uniref:Flagellar protein n=1 Tax=Thraustotheca clavata TaxID=74557 RepID=A0A1V9YVD0_9STRA|nr:flagellar protein [Thraustotheca clavata]
MSELLLTWLNEDMKLSRRVNEFEAAFASGYLVGEILYKANQQHNFGDFIDMDSADAKIVNFCLLEPTMRALEIRMDPVFAVSIMNEEKGAAAKLLYQLKMAIERTARSGAVSCKLYKAGGILPIHNVPGRLPKHVYDPVKHKSFEHSIRLHVKAQDELKREKLKKEATVQLAKDMADKKAAYHENLEATRQQRLHLTKIQREFTQITTEGETEAWTTAQAKRHERERRKARYNRLVASKQKQRQVPFIAIISSLTEAITTECVNEVTHSIAAFEKTNGFIPVKQPKTNSPLKKMLPRQMSIGYGVRSLRTAFKQVDVTVPENRIHHHPQHHTKKEDEFTPQKQIVAAKRQQRELRCEIQKKRRTKFLKKCVDRQKKVNDDVVQMSLETTLLRPSSCELQLDAKRKNIVAYMDVVAENRAAREKCYFDRQDADDLEAIARDACAYGMLHHRYTDAVFAQNERAERLKEASTAAILQSHVALCQEVLLRIIELTDRAANYRATSMWILPKEVFIPEPTWHEYLSFFTLASDKEFTDWTLEPCLNTLAYREHITTTRNTTLIAEGRNTCAISDQNPQYIFGKLERNHVLGEVIKYCRSITAPLLLPPATEPLPKFALKLALLGKPFTGRKTCAKALQQKYNLAVLSVHTLLESARKEQSSLGTRASQLLKSGQMVPNELYVELLKQAITSLDQNQYQGWIIVDYLSNADEAQDVERFLSGMVEDALPPTSEVFASILAPGVPPKPLPLNYFQGRSGLDLVFGIEIDRTKLYRHCLGKLVDPISNERFHMQYDPPKDTSITRFRLQQWRDPVVANEIVSLLGQSYDVATRELYAWFDRYSTLRHIKTDDPTTTMCDYIDEYLHRLSIQADQAKRAVEAAATVEMEAQETRQRQISSMDDNLILALQDEANASQALKAGEEAKLKKDELTSLRTAVDVAHQSVVDATATANQFFHAEKKASQLVPEVSSIIATEPLAQYLSALWAICEENYEKSLERGFSMVREYRSRVEQHAVGLMEYYCAFVRRADLKQSIVDAFQLDFNLNIVEDMRFDEATKMELHLRTDTLFDALSTTLAEKLVESSAMLESLLHDQWKEDVIASIQLIATMCFQAEVDRFFASVTLLVDAIAGFEVGLLKLDDAKPPQLPWKEPTEEEKEATTVQTNSKKKKAPAVVEVEVIPLTPTQEVALNAQKARETCANFVTKWLKLPNALGTTSGTATPERVPLNKKDAHHADKGGLASGQSTPVPKKDTIASANAMQALSFEYDLVLSRLGALQRWIETTIEHVEMVFSKLEKDLRAFLDSRMSDEKCAVVALVEFIRSKIEAEENIPYRLVVEESITSRIPPLSQFIQDTQVRYDNSTRVIEKSVAPPYPQIEQWDEMYLNNRQLNSLVAVLRDCSGGVVSRPVFAEIFARMATRPSMVLPEQWQSGNFEHLASFFDKKESGLIKFFPEVVKSFQAKDLVQEILSTIKCE